MKRVSHIRNAERYASWRLYSNLPHNGLREMERRKRQLARGFIK